MQVVIVKMMKMMNCHVQYASASEVTTLWRYTDLFIIIF